MSLNEHLREFLVEPTSEELAVRWLNSVVRHKSNSESKASEIANWLQNIYKPGYWSFVKLLSGLASLPEDQQSTYLLAVDLALNAWPNHARFLGSHIESLLQVTQTTPQLAQLARVFGGHPSSILMKRPDDFEADFARAFRSHSHLNIDDDCIDKIQNTISQHPHLQSVSLFINSIKSLDFLIEHKAKQLLSLEVICSNFETSLAELCQFENLQQLTLCISGDKTRNYDALFGRVWAIDSLTVDSNFLQTMIRHFESFCRAFPKLTSLNITLYSEKPRYFTQQIDSTLHEKLRDFWSKLRTVRLHMSSSRQLDAFQGILRTFSATPITLVIDEVDAQHGSLGAFNNLKSLKLVANQRPLSEESLALLIRDAKFESLTSLQGSLSFSSGIVKFLTQDHFPKLQSLELIPDSDDEAMLIAVNLSKMPIDSLRFNLPFHKKVPWGLLASLRNCGVFKGLRAIAGVSYKDFLAMVIPELSAGQIVDLHLLLTEAFIGKTDLSRLAGLNNLQHLAIDSYIENWPSLFSGMSGSFESLKTLTCGIYDTPFPDMRAFSEKRFPNLEKLYLSSTNHGDLHSQRYIKPFRFVG